MAHSSMTRNPTNPHRFRRAMRRGSAGVIALIWIVAIAGVAFYIYRTNAIPAPAKIAVAGARPERAQFSNGSWYWLENAAGPHAQLVQLTNGNVTPITTADEINSFDISPSA